MNERILTRKQVVAVTGRSATSLWRAVRIGAFPPPRQISSARIGWLASEVEAWLKSRPVVAGAVDSRVQKQNM
jgi:prophage regulatory protein